VENWGGMFLTVYLYESASVLEVVVVFVAAVVDTVGLGVTEDAGVDVWRTWGLTLPPRWSWCGTWCLAWRRPAECRAPCTALLFIR
jgi:hypothetical protein